jgi:nitroimidazol reductase NimA-like FMN-containing flavoprotein (pyridoxamine 5'-phosphate oxidase superfamily)
MAALEALTATECWDRLRSQRVGRIGFDRGRGRRIHPVQYTVDGDAMRLTTSRDSELGVFCQLFAQGALVPFEIDQLAEDHSERWSVLVLGRLTSEENVGVVDARDGAPRPPEGHDELALRLTPIEVTGRRRTDPH